MNKKPLTLLEFKQWMDERIDEYEREHTGSCSDWDEDEDYMYGCCEGYYRAMRHVEEFLKERVEDDADIQN